MRRRILLLLLGLITTATVTVAPATTSSAPSAEAAVRKHVATDYTLLRRGPASYVIGTAYRGWTVDIHGDQISGYRWGRVYGDLNACLWIYGEDVPSSVELRWRPGRDHQAAVTV